MDAEFRSTKYHIEDLLIIPHNEYKRNIHYEIDMSLIKIHQ